MVEVAELFGNVPARRKFLKSATTEWGHVGDWLARAALALPRVHFDVRRDGKNAFSWPSVENPLDRIAAVLFVLIGGGTAKEQRVERQDEHALPVIQLAGTELTGYYYKLSLLNRDKSLIANILYYRDEERVCPFTCKLHIRTELDTQIEPMVNFDDVVKMFNGEHVEFE